VRSSSNLVLRGAQSSVVGRSSPLSEPLLAPRIKVALPDA
jgi:hypothetical protein